MVAEVATVVLGYAQYKQQGAAGKYNQSIQNRNAEIADQEAVAIEKQKEFDIARFDKNFAQLQSQTTTRILKTHRLQEFLMNFIKLKTLI